MPLPLLFIGIAAATGLIGAGKSIKAAVDISDAKDTNKQATSIIANAKYRLEKSRAKSKSSIDGLGRKKLDILNTTVNEFVTWFGKLKNVDFHMSSGLDELSKISFNRQDLKELKAMGAFATSVLGGITGGALGGAITAFGAYSAAGTFAAASTGTAIASLSGAAATNATLAFFWGGSLAAGGLGMAGGTAVLGGLVAGPALAIMGFIVGAKASTELNKAKENLAFAKKNAAELDLASEMCQAISKRADLFVDLLCQLDAYTVPLINRMKNAIRRHGDDYSSLDLNEKKSVAACVASVKAIKAILDTPILTKDGNLTNESYEIIHNATPESIIKKVNKGLN